MKKLNNSEIDKVSGGNNDLQLRTNGDKYELIQVLGSFDSEEERLAYLCDNTMENIQDKGRHEKHGRPPCGPCGKQRNSGICNMPNPFAGKPDQK